MSGPNRTVTVPATPRPQPEVRRSGASTEPPPAKVPVGPAKDRVPEPATPRAQPEVRWRRARTTALALAAGLLATGLPLTGTARAGAANVPQTDFCKAMDKPVDVVKLGKDVVDPSLQFAADLYKVVAATPGNQVFSPLSIDAALAMTLAGAKGATAREMAQVLHLPGAPDAAFHESFAHLIASLTCPGSYKTSELALANALYVQKSKALAGPFKDLMKQDYDARLDQVDFKKDAESARQKINAWVARATGGKIQDLVHPRDLTSDTRLVLVDAVYLKARWDKEFEKSETKDDAFHTTVDRTVKTPMMHREGGAYDYGYAVMDGYKVVSLKTRDHHADLVLFVPDQIDGLAALEGKVDGPMLRKALDGQRAQKVDLTLPKFKLTADLPLKETLTKLGMKKLFEAGADLSGIDGGVDQLYLGQVVHQAYVDVNEEGVEAAAATAAMAFAGAAMPAPSKPLVVKVDRPFLYLLVDHVTHAVLFMGRVTDPTKPVS